MAIVSAVLMIGALAAGIILAVTMKPPSAKDTNMRPLGLDSFQINQNQEGQPVPMVWGKVRITTNILWYGNLRTEPIIEKVGGKGFGGKKSKQITGFNYYMDIWHALCQGPGVTLHNVYLNDHLKDLSDLGTYTFNDGDDGTYPTEPGAYSSPITGVAHLFLDSYFIGANVNSIPTMHFIISRVSTAPLTYVNETKGVNPAAVIYDLLLEAGVTVGDIDLASFNEAATYWHDKGYALNITINKQSDVRDHINQVFTYVDGALRIDENDKFVLKAYRDSDSSVATIDTEKFKTFEFKRRSWDDVYNDFRANFIDEDSEYTTRTVRVRNPAVRSLIGQERQKVFDLTAFRDLTTTSKRMWELMKRFSYPEAQIKATVGIEYAGVNVGDIVTINYTDYDISSADFRVISKDEADIEGNDISFELVQSLETLFDDNFGTVGGTSWTTPDYTAAAFTHQRVIELPFSEEYGTAPVYLCLGAREGQEDSFSVLYSPDGSDYTTHAVSENFAQYGTLDVEYTVDTETIDDDIGIYYTPYIDDPEFSSISRTSLFTVLRFAVLYNTSNDTYELVAFQTVTPVGGSGYRLTGVIRGLLNTVVQTHTIANTEVWLVNLGSNVISGITATNFYLKLAPNNNGETVALASCTPIAVTGQNLAATPWPSVLIKVTKTGSSNVVDITPTTRLYLGAGARDGEAQTDQDPPEIEGTFQWYTSADPTVTTETAAAFTITQAGAFTLYTREQVSGFSNAWQATSISDSDGTYYGPAE